MLPNRIITLEFNENNLFKITAIPPKLPLTKLFGKQNKLNDRADIKAPNTNISDCLAMFFEINFSFTLSLFILLNYFIFYSPIIDYNKI